MAASIIWDLVKLADVGNTRNGIRLSRGLLVKGVDPVINETYGSDPAILLKCLGVSGFPQIDDEFPDPAYTWLTVREQRMREFVRKDCLKFDIIYQGLDPEYHADDTPTWVVQEGFVSSAISTMSTADDSKTIESWYLKGHQADTTMPAGATVRPGSARKYVSDRHVKVLARMSRSQWNARKAAYRSTVNAINDDDWSGGTRGTWMFYGPQTTTKNNGDLLVVESNFVYNERGYFPLNAWFNNGHHPKDSVVEGDLRGRGLPAYGDLLQGNGLTIASVQKEANFSTIFEFTLD